MGNTGVASGAAHLVAFSQSVTSLLLVIRGF